MSELYRVLQPGRCFNPYFHGVVAAIAKVYSWFIASAGFNPYFHGVVAAITSISLDNCLYVCVSILIFMEWSLQYTVQYRVCSKTTGGFNPYFHGVVAAIVESNKDKEENDKFQSLFSWSGRCNMGFCR